MFQWFKRKPADHRLFLLDQMPRGGMCAEIGTWKGDFSEKMLRVTEPRELHLIDPWAFQPQFPKRWYGGGGGPQSQADMDAIYQSVSVRFADYNRVTVHRKTSLEAAAALPDHYFDWVYIDGDHSYQAVLDDLKAWLPKVKGGGFITGDDYGWRDENRRASVQDAVFEFTRAMRTPLTVKNGQFLFRV